MKGEKKKEKERKGEKEKGGFPGTSTVEARWSEY